MLKPSGLIASLATTLAATVAVTLRGVAATSGANLNSDDHLTPKPFPPK